MRSSFFYKRPALGEVDVFSDDVEAFIGHARLLIESEDPGQREKGIEIAKKALEMDAANDNVVSFFKEHYKVKLLPFMFLNDLSHEQPCPGILYRAYLLFADKQYQKMFDVINELLAIDPIDPNGLYCRALACFRLDKGEQGLFYINQAIELDANRMDFYMLRANHYYACEHQYKMTKDFMTILQINETQNGNPEWSELCQVLQHSNSEIMELIKEHDGLKEKKEKVVELERVDAQRYEELSDYLNETFRSSHSRDRLPGVPSLVSIVGSFLFRDAGLVQQRFRLPSELQERIQDLDRRIIPYTGRPSFM